MLSAMDIDIIWVVITLLAIAAWLGWLVHLLRQDGLGERPAPRSRPDWTEAPELRTFAR